MASHDRDREGRMEFFGLTGLGRDRLSRRRLLQLLGGTALAAGTPTWLSRSAFGAELELETHCLEMDQKHRAQGGFLEAFCPPAFHEDFPAGSEHAKRFHQLWNYNLNQFTEQAILGFPWGSNFNGPNPFYFNPVTTRIPPASAGKTAYKLVEWTAFPNRITAYLRRDFSQDQLFELADNGRLSDGTTLPQIPQNTCPYIDAEPGPMEAFGPYGPRGWQDEYCEWAVQRNSDRSKDPNGAITRITFTCENPEYWHTLWAVDPNKVLELYQQLVSRRVTLRDLSLGGGSVIDPLTDRPVYNPLNKWNDSTVLGASSGGAVHLTSPPNNLAAEIGIGASATLLRHQDANPQELLCCAEYGQNFRHSDPHIGFTINQAVRELGMRLTVCNPVGLYIQKPDLQNVALPQEAVDLGLTADDFWHVVRGNPRPLGQPGTMTLRAEFRAPKGLEYLDLSEITVEGKPLRWGSQIATTFQVGLVGLLIPRGNMPIQQELPCLSSEDPAPNRPTPTQLLDCDIMMAQIDAGVPAESYSAAPVAQRGQTLENMALQCTGVGVDTAVTFLHPKTHQPLDDPSLPEDERVTVTHRGFIDDQCIPIGGFTDVLILDIHVGAKAPIGQLDVRLGSPFNIPGRAFLTVEA